MPGEPRTSCDARCWQSAVAPGTRPKPRAGRAALPVRHRSGYELERAGAQRCYECVDLDCRMQPYAAGSAAAHSVAAQHEDLDLMTATR